MRANHTRISHYLSSDRTALDTLRGSARALLPSLRLEPVEARADAPYRYGRVVRLRGPLKVLRSDGQPEASAGLLAAVQPLGTSEHLLIRWVLQPDCPQRVPQPQDPIGRTLPSEHRRLLKLKNEGSVLRARGLVAVASHPERAPSCRVFADRCASGELAGLLAWPIDAPVLPGVNLGTSPLLMPSQRLPRTGRVLGVATWPGAEPPRRPTRHRDEAARARGEHPRLRIRAHRGGRARALRALPLEPPAPAERGLGLKRPVRGRFRPNPIHGSEDRHQTRAATRPRTRSPLRAVAFSPGPDLGAYEVLHLSRRGLADLA